MEQAKVFRIWHALTGGVGCGSTETLSKQKIRAIQTRGLSCLPSQEKQ
jgi:hypothetical protein